MSDIEAGPISTDDFEWFSKQTQEYYKRSRAEVGKDENLVRLYSGESARFGEEAFRRVPESDAFIAIILGRDVIDGYFIAERYSDVLRFSSEYLGSLGDLVSRSIAGGIEMLRTVSLEKLSEQNLIPQP